MSRANPRYRRFNAPGIAIGTNSTVEYIIKGTAEGQTVISGFSYYVALQFPSPTQLSNALTSISGILKTAYLNCICIDYAMVSETLIVTSSNTTQGVVSTANAGALGARPTPHLPLTNAIIINKASVLKGQHGRGRLSLPCVSEGDTLNSYVSLAAEKNALAILALAMLTQGTDGANAYVPCITTRSPVTPRLVTNYVLMTAARVNFLLGTIRKRKIGRGK